MPNSALNLVKVAGNLKGRIDLLETTFLHYYVFEEKKRLSNTKEICFDLTKRGSIGETLVHLCFLNGTRVHNELARLMIKHFPKMVNDIYTSEEFYGKSQDDTFFLRLGLDSKVFT